MQPSKADALPAFLLNGARESADVFGKVNPWQHKKMKIRKIVLNTPNKPMRLPAKSAIPVRV
jgi:hypothetical protein